MTFSIIARDENTGELGIGVCTGHFAIGALVPHIKPRVGIIATQAYLTPALGKVGINYLAGTSVDETLSYMQRIDKDFQQRQIHLMDWNGNCASFTGNESPDKAKGMSDKNISVAGNILVSSAVVDSMFVKAKLAQSEGLAIHDVIMLAMQEAINKGGDRRGHNSAAISVYDDEDWAKLDLRVDYSNKPIKDISNLLELWKTNYVQDYWLTCPKKDTLDL